MTEGYHIGLATLVGSGTIGAEIDVLVIVQVGVDAAHADHVFGISGGDDGHPSAVVAFVAGGVTNQDALFDGFVGGFGHVGSAIHVLGPMAVLAVAQRAVDDVCTVLVGPFGTLRPPHLFFKGFRVDFGAGQEELSTGGETEFLTFFIYAGDAAQYHGAVGAPAIDVLLFVGEVIGLENLMVIAKMLESGVSVHLWEATVHDADAHAFAIDAFVNEMLATETFQLIGEDVFVVVFNILELGLNAGNRPIGDDFLHLGHERQLCNQSCIVISCFNADSVEPARLAENLVGVGANRVDIAVVQRVIADVVKVGTALLVAFDGLGIEIGIGIKLGVVFVGEEYPETLVLCHYHAI